MSDEKFEGFLRPNLSPDQSTEVESLWHRYALAALQGITRSIDFNETSPDEASELAGEFADEMVAQWDARFNESTWLNEVPEEPSPTNDRAPAPRRGHDDRGSRGRGRR